MSLSSLIWDTIQEAYSTNELTNSNDRIKARQILYKNVLSLIREEVGKCIPLSSSFPMNAFISNLKEEGYL